MKYGESTFDIIYLVFAIIIGLRILKKRKDDIGRIMGFAVLILGCGDAFHLVPRILNYFVDADFTVWLGIGKLVTSISMTVFYVLMYKLWLKVFREAESSRLSAAIYLLTVIRIVLCLLPQNRWLQNEGSVMWGIIRNIPFVALGAVIVWLYFKTRDKLPRLRSLWLLVLLSFLFYIPVAVLASIVPMLGMLMLPKTVCYMLMIWAFWKYAAEK
ncbi:MAG: hypothetical protein IJM08_07750 [Firmicutes bacterium]|nr:hypothetical protein [Bacillota bacterium]